MVRLPLRCVPSFVVTLTLLPLLLSVAGDRAFAFIPRTAYRSAVVASHYSRVCLRYFLFVAVSLIVLAVYLSLPFWCSLLVFLGTVFCRAVVR